jgi:DNA repair protein RecN (Recombination protein N)
VLSLLKIKNVALIDELEIEFGPGLNLLTGETGSGKSIIVDSLSALTGDRISNDIIKEGTESAKIEGLFTLVADATAAKILDESGIESDSGELIVRRELLLSGKNRVFVNNQLVTQAFLKKIGPRLADIHGQGEQATLYDVDSHIKMLDGFAAVDALKRDVADAFRELSSIRYELASLEKDESEKLQLLDILRFQADEITRAKLQPGEDVELEEEKRRLNNVEKLSTLSDDAFNLLYESDASTIATLEKALRKVAELAEFDGRFHDHDDGLASAQAVLTELAHAIRDFRGSLEFSPERLNEIEERLAEISRLKRKYGDSLEAVLEHLRVAEDRLQTIETAEFHEEELKKRLAVARREYIRSADKLHEKRIEAAKRFAKKVEHDLKAVALEKARFEVRFEPNPDETNDIAFTADGYDRVEFYFSANPGESPRPLARIASGGEASRLMLILKTVARPAEVAKTSVFDEIDIGIGGRVAEAVGRKLKDLAATQQVFCVTHQPQIASLADHHFLVEKIIGSGRARIDVHELSATERVEELARMLAGEYVTEAARENARAMLTAVN